MKKKTRSWESILHPRLDGPFSSFRLNDWALPNFPAFRKSGGTPGWRYLRKSICIRLLTPGIVHFIDIHDADKISWPRAGSCTWPHTWNMRSLSQWSNRKVYKSSMSPSCCPSQENQNEFRFIESDILSNSIH